jgi:hypothetical protein
MDVPVSEQVVHPCDRASSVDEVTLVDVILVHQLLVFLAEVLVLVMDNGSLCGDRQYHLHKGL